MPTPYTPPIADQIFTLQHLAGYDGPLDLTMVETVLEEAGKLAANILAPLNATGDKNGAKRAPDGSVATAPGWRDAYRAYRDGGWNAVPFPEEFGGQGMPWSIAFPIQELWQGANMAFGLCPLLNQGAVEALIAHGSPQQQALYLPKLISGEWTGTMNLTEPQAGSDLAAIRTKAEAQDDGTYRITGQKIFITYGDHDLADNITHLVLARTPGAPVGAKGISLFIVPKFLIKTDGTLGPRNDVTCAALEHKLGIHASPTCTMAFGDRGGATGYLVGAEHEGLRYMFTMMNNARLSVGLQGVAIAERATQAAIAYAAVRVQGRDIITNEPAAIAMHPDVKRMILTMQSLTFAARALTFAAAVDLDRAHMNDGTARDRVDLMTPIVKSWATDIAQQVTSLAVQVHGGAGFIEETGVAQFFRDARILPIYEGTNGIQATDLLFRKVARTGGDSVTRWIAWVLKSGVSHELAEYLRLLGELTVEMVARAKDKPDTAAAAATPYLNAFATIAAGVMMARAGDAPGSDARIKDLAQFYRIHLLPSADLYARQARG